MSYWWVTFENHSPGCVDAMTAEEAAQKAAAFGTVKQVQTLPYPTSARLGEHNDTPDFCWKPSQCAGRTACPQRISCTE